MRGYKHHMAFLLLLLILRNAMGMIDSLCGLLRGKGTIIYAAPCPDNH